MGDQDTVFPSKFSLNINGKLFDLSTPVIMGILNLTEDSFHDGGKYIDLKNSLAQTEKMLLEGASFIDVGAASSRPNAKTIPIDQEKKRVFEYLENARKRFPEAIFSIDTFHSKIASGAIERGASIVNDISGGMRDEELWNVVAEKKAVYILMHIQGEPKNMQKNPQYLNVVSEVGHYFSEKLKELKTLGIKDIVLDPGFGFGKTIEHNYTLLNSLEHFKMFSRPLMVGLSRKSMIYKVLRVDPKDALKGTSMLHLVALENGANVLRAHDVKEAKECIDLYLNRTSKESVKT